MGFYTKLQSRVAKDVGFRTRLPGCKLTLSLNSATYMISGKLIELNASVFLPEKWK